MSTPGRSSPERLLHRVNLDAVGGVEVSFLQYQSYRQAKSAVDTVFVGDSVHPRFTRALAPPVRTVWRASTKRWHGVRIPRIAHRLRAKQAARLIAPGAPSAVLAWNHIGNREIADIAGILRRPLIHYEHGEAWRPSARYANYFLERVDGTIANSLAAERILALRWNWSGPTKRVYCTVEDVLPLDSARRRRPNERLRIGSAARMVEVKGHRIALYTLQVLRETYGMDATLAMAGTGEDEEALHAEAKRLGLMDFVDFQGSVADMAGFYDHLDVMLVPSLVEPFGRTSLEAQARGCPVVVSAIDGLPETLAPENTSALVTPTLSLAEYAAELGGNTDAVLPWAYDPQGDTLIEPRAVAPDKLAEAVKALVSSDDVYHEASMSGLRNVHTHFLSAGYGPAVDDAVMQLIGPAAGSS